MAFIRCEECIGGRVPCGSCGGSAYDEERNAPCAFCYDGSEQCPVCEGVYEYGVEDPDDEEGYE